MNQYDVVAEHRSETGTSASRRYRREGKIPAVLYGAEKDPTPLLLDANEIGKQLQHEAFFSHVLNVKVGKEETQAVLRSLQRDPASYKVTHLDFLRVSATQEIQMNVPLHFIHEETCPGKRAGGIVTHLMVDVEISCLPQNLPEYLEVDMAALNIGDSLHLSDIKLPEGVRFATAIDDPAHDHPIVSIEEAYSLDLGEEPEEEVAAEALEGEVAVAEGEEGEAAAAEEAGEDESKGGDRDKDES